jgi:NADH:ubiquinone oxidoreductase subunit 2 (subunit N)
MKRFNSHAYFALIIKTYLSSLILLIISLVFLVSRRSPIFFWIILELNLIFVLFLIFEDVVSVKAIICYFVFQIYGRLLFIYGFINYSFIFLSFLGLIIKFGLFPFHVWQPYVFKYSRWKTCFIIAGPQKAFLILLFIFFNIKINNFIILILIVTIVVANLYLIFLFDLKKTFAFLSIGSATWLLCLIRWSIERNLWFLYIYNFQLICIFIVFLMYELYNIQRKKYLNLLILIFIIRYSGIPPMIGFFIKLQILNFFFYMSQSILILVLFRMIMIPSTFFLVYYRMIFFLKKKMIVFQHISLFFTIMLITLFLIPSFMVLL